MVIWMLKQLSENYKEVNNDKEFSGNSISMKKKDVETMKKKQSEMKNDIVKI